MGQISNLGRTYLREYATDGVPSSGQNKPKKAHGRAVFDAITAARPSIANGATIGNAVVFSTKSAMDGDLGHSAGTLGVVYNDSTASNNGIYRKSGGSGSGSWAATNLALPSTFAADLAALESEFDGLTVNDLRGITSIAAASSIDVSAVSSDTIRITGNGDIAALGTMSGGAEITLIANDSGGFRLINDTDSIRILGGDLTVPQSYSVTLKSHGSGVWRVTGGTAWVRARLLEKADESAVVQLTGNQTIAGTKTFASAPSVPDGSFAIAKVSGLQSALNGMVSTSGDQTISGTKTFSSAPSVPDSSFAISKVSGLQAALDDIDDRGVNDWRRTATIDAAANMDLSAYTHDMLRLTGYAEIETLGDVPGGAEFVLIANDGFVLKHDSSKIRVPGGDLQVEAAYSVIVRSYGGNIWRVIGGTAWAKRGLDTKADDSAVVKLTGDQTIVGTKTFSSAPSVPDGSFAFAKVSGLQTALDGKLEVATARARYAQYSRVAPPIRPGEGIEFFTSALDGEPSGLSALPDSAAVTSQYGKVAKIDGAGTVAPVAAWRIEPGHLYRVRFVVTRAVDTEDPSNDAVRLGIRWLAAGKTGVGTTELANILDLTVEDGRVERVFTLATAAAPDVDVTPPAGGIYFRPFVRAFGSGTTHVEIIQVVDATDAVVWSPSVEQLQGQIASLTAQLQALADRIEALEA